ncbi:MAG: hypothetical protein LCH54_13025 [Bacteroidetes bacterium]|nr:hypothetical protein [Bacteroidota bacterium]MCA0447141.1 hypothetical protein [Bacteroidota bacterium]
MKNLIYFIALYIMLLMGCNKTEEGATSSSVLKLIWKSPLNKNLGLQGFELPIIDGNRVYFPNGPNIDCRELTTGKLLWTKNVAGTTKDYIGTNFPVNSTQIVIDDAFSTRGMNKITGEQLWLAPDSGVQRDYGSLSWIDENFGYRHPTIENAKKFIQYDLFSGNTIKEFVLDTGRVNAVIGIPDGLLINTFAFSYDSRNDPIYGFGEIMKFNPYTGQLEFKIRVKPRYVHLDIGSIYLSTKSNLFSAPVLDGEVGFSVFDDGTVIKYRLTDGKVLWKFELEYSVYRKDYPSANCLILDKEKNKLFVTGSRDNWYCLNPETGKLIYWKKLSDYDGNSFPSSYDGNRYVFKPHTFSQNEWYIIDINTGEIIEEFDQPNDSILSQDIKNGYIAAFGVLNFYVYQIVK